MAKTLGITYIWYGMPDWDAVVAAKPAIVVLNPNSGPGPSQNHYWNQIVSACKKAGIKVIGYVPLNYGDRPRDIVLQEASRYFEWYNLDGIFWDEAPTNPLVYSGKYRGVHGYARKVDKTGISVFNPGANPATISTLMTQLPGSIWVTFEGPEWYYQQQMPRPSLYKSRHAHIIYGVSSPTTKALLELSGVGYGFVTNDDLPNPYDSWPIQWYN